MQWICFMYPSLTAPLFIYMPVLTRQGLGGTFRVSILSLLQWFTDWIFELF